MARDKDGNYYPASQPQRLSSYDEWLARRQVTEELARRAKKQAKVKPPRRSPAKPAGQLYWAYGSNLSIRQMAQRCPDAEMVGPLVVDDGALVFRGVADVVGRRGSRVAGGLWRITPRCERTLDHYEGVSKRLYMKRYLTIAIDGGEPEDVLFYQMRTHRGVMPPTDAYLRTIADGYADFGLDVARLDQALSEAWQCKELTPTLRDRRRRQRQAGIPSLARAVPSIEEDVA